jgi:hypothetical protein
MIPAEEIEEFLKGSDPEQYIVSVEFDYVSDSIYKIIEDPIKGKIVKRDTFIPFLKVQRDFKKKQCPNTELLLIN